MGHNVYLLTYPVRQNRFNGSRAHWGIFIPSKTKTADEPDDGENGDNDFGKVIHVTGTPFTGYGLEFKRNYDLSETGRAWRKYALATLDEKYVETSVHGDGKFCIDVTPQDVLEAEAKKIDPPGPSPEPLNPNKGKRCQAWIREYIGWLIQRGILSESTEQVLDEAKAMEQDLV